MQKYIKFQLSKKEEYTLTLEQINEIFNVDRLVFCSAESVEILMQSCSKYQKDIRSLQAEPQHMNVATQEKLMQYGLLSKEAKVLFRYNCLFRQKY